MLQQARTGFRTFNQSGGLPINLADVIINPGTLNFSEWSPGATLIDSVALAPSLSQEWELIAFSVTANLVYLANIPTYGKLGRVVAALIADPHGTDPTPTNSGSGIFYEGGGVTGNAQPRPLPVDPSLQSDLWHPAVDSMCPVATSPIFIPPKIASPPPLFPISAEVTLPVPRALLAGATIGIGIWLTPSLLGNVSSALAIYGLVVYGAQYTVTYDDGR